jgi:hypothetical protein
MGGACTSALLYDSVLHPGVLQMLHMRHTLELLLLACWQLGEAASPLDISRWALDGQLPYLNFAAVEGTQLAQFRNILGPDFIIIKGQLAAWRCLLPGAAFAVAAAAPAPACFTCWILQMREIRCACSRSYEGADAATARPTACCRRASAQLPAHPCSPAGSQAGPGLPPAQPSSLAAALPS